MTSAARVGSVLGGFRVDELIARGGMGVVYRATQLSLDRAVALKVVAPELAAEPRFRERFLREARLAASLDHPNVLPVYEAGEADGILFLAMRLVAGESLAAILGREGRLEPSRAVGLVSQLAGALDAAHTAGLVHRDVKPANVLVASAVSGEHAYLCDFGVSRRLAAGTSAITSTGGFLGTAAYAAPEQIRGGDIDRRADVYALGCVLHECLTGAPPFRLEDELALLWAQMHEPPTLPGQLDETLAAFDAVVGRALAKNPDDRYASAGELAEAAGEPAREKPARPAHVLGAHSGLPLPGTALVGRLAELAEVTELLLRDGTRLLTLTGPGGTGKTRLALQAAADVADAYPDGVFWAPLASLRDAALVLSAVAQTMEVNEQPGKELVETLAERLTEKRILLVLDNAEHLLPEVAAEVRRLRNAAPALVVLVTSRERLQLTGEEVWPVPALVVREGIELFLARARSLGAAPVDDRGVRELCTHLDNLPLALELAAARTVVFSPVQLLERLGQRLDLLKGGRDVDPRQQTLRATIDWSYELLGEEEQRVFRTLSVFAGGCTYEAAEQVAGADPDTLQSLLDKSLLRRRDTGLGPRYWMLESIREYARDRFGDEERASAEASLVSWVLVLAERAEPHLRGPDQLTWLATLDAELANIRVASGLLHAAGDVNRALCLARAVSWWLWRRGKSAEARVWLEASLDLPGANASLRRASLLALLEGLSDLGDESGLRAACEEALTLAERDGDDVLLAAAYERLGYLERSDDGRRMLERAAAIFERLGRHDDCARTAINSGARALRFGEYDDAIRWSTQAVERCKKLGNRHGVAVAKAQIGEALVLLGRYAAAVPQLLEAASDFELLGDDAGLTWVVELAALIHIRRGEEREACLLLGSARATNASLRVHTTEQQTQELLAAALDGAVNEPAIEGWLSEGASLDVGQAVSRWRSVLGESALLGPTD